MSTPTVTVIHFPGSLDHEAATRVMDEIARESHRVTIVSHRDASLPEDTAAVVLPGGFSYGDHLRCGAIASRAPIMDAVRTFAESGGPVLGICNGFQILCESGLLPGVLRPNDTQAFICRQATLAIVDDATPWTGGHASGETLSVPIKHHDGAWQGDADACRIVFRYRGENPNGSQDRVAGIANVEGNVMGLMPHPEMACEDLLGSADGRVIMGGLISGSAVAA